LEKAFDNRPAKFQVHSFDEDGNPVNGEPIEVKVIPIGGSYDGKDDTVTVQVVDKNDGTYDVSYNATKPGDYMIHTNIRGKPIRDMPKKVHCYKGSDASKTIVEGPGVTGGYAGKELPFTIRAIDKDGQPVPVGGDHYTVKVEGPTNQDVKVKDNGDGTYSGSYIAHVPGDYKVHVSVEHDKNPVGKSPYHVKVKPGADPKESFAVGAGWKEAYDAIPAKFSIYAKDKDGKDVPGAEVKAYIKNVTPSDQKAKLQKEMDKMDPYIKKKKIEEKRRLEEQVKQQKAEAEAKAKAEGKAFKTDIGQGDIPIEIRDNGDGTYFASYLPIDPGTYEINVLVNGEHIKESPKIVPCHLTRPKIVYWQHTYDAEQEESTAIKKKIALAEELLKKHGISN